MVAAPIGYERPPFPSLYWPLGPSYDSFNSSFLYYTRDVWEFTTLWTIIWMTGIYTASAALILINNYIGSYRHPLTKSKKKNSSNSNNGNEYQEDASPISNEFSSHDYYVYYHHYVIDSLFHGNRKVIIAAVFLYIIIGAVQGFIAGSVVGVLIAAIYNSTQFKVTTWIPFVYSIIITLYNISSSYSFTVKSL